MTERPRLIVASPGTQPYHEHALATLVEDFEVVLVDKDYPTWQGRYVEKHRVARTTDAARLFYSVADLRGEVADAAVLTWDPASVVAVAQVASKLGLRSISPDAARLCADRAELYEALSVAALPMVRHRTVRTAEEVPAAASEVGYPVLVSRSGWEEGATAVAASVDELDVALSATSTQPRSASPASGFVVEHHGDGLALTAHCVVLDGKTVVVAVSRVLPPENDPASSTGWEIGPWQQETWAEELRSIAGRANSAVGVDWAVTQVDLRSGADGLEVTGLRPWPAGDLIPVLVKAATGIDLIGVAAAIAFEQDPMIELTRDRYAAIRFLPAPRNGKLTALNLPNTSVAESLFATQALAAVGDEIATNGTVPARLAGLLAVGDDVAEVRDALAEAVRAGSVEIE